MKQEVVILGGQTIDQMLRVCSWSSSIKIWFLQYALLKKCHGVNMQKYMPLVKQNVMKFEVFILGGQRIDQKRNKGWWRGRRERIEKGSRERIEKREKGTELTI